MRQLDHFSNGASRPALRLAPTPPARGVPTWQTEQRPIELKVSFRELTLIHKSLEAAKILGAHEQDELFNDTIHLVDLALSEAV
jgi:hypothetical protein